MANGELGGMAAGAGREADEFLSLESLLDKKRTTTSADKVKAKRDLISYTPTMFIGLGACQHDTTGEITQLSALGSSV